jgi:sec-independent protein translocase protein TatA
MADLGPAELIIVFLVLALLFGGSRLADLGGALGKSVREFRKAIQEDAKPDTAAGVDPTARSEVNSIQCSECGLRNPASARFCQECGMALGTSQSALAPPVNGVPPSLTASRDPGKWEELP